MSIVITGATGKLGTLIIKHLLTKLPAKRIVACVRHVEKAAAFTEQGIEVRYGDYDHPESLEKAFAGASKLLLISSPHADDTTRIRQHSQAIEAVKKARVGQILYTSFAFPEKGAISLTQLHLATEYAIRTTGIPYTFLRSALYSDFIGALGLKEAIASGTWVTYPGDWSFNTITRDDLARGIATVLSSQEHQNRTYELTASRSWSLNELAAVLSELTGKSISHREDRIADSWIYRFLAKIDASSTTLDLETLIGGETTSLKEAVRQIMEP